MILGREFITARWREIFVLFLLFALWGGWPVPDVNEQYYVGKAIHFWNPNWLAADPFLNTPDSHWFFYATFGLLSFLSQTAMTWTGRIIVWFLTAWSWQNLSFTLIPRRWGSLLTGIAFLFFLENFHMAGEWIIGGVEGKGFAFPFVFWGIAAYLQGRPERCWILLGIASAFHVLVGGYSVIAIMFAMAIQTVIQKREDKPQIRRAGPIRGLLLGGAIALVGLIPALMLDYGTATEVVRQAHQIYVYERLPHHLVPSTLPWIFPVRFALLIGIWMLLGLAIRQVRDNRQSSDCESYREIWRKIDLFVIASLLIAGIGILIDSLCVYGIIDKPIAAEILRFYLFRLSDWAVPMGVAFSGVALLLIGMEDDNSSFFGRFIFWIIASFTLFGMLKIYLIPLAHRIAMNNPVASGIVMTPRPVEGITFLATIALLLLVLTIALAIPMRRASASLRSPLFRIGLLWIAGLLIVIAPGYYVAGRLNLRASPVIARSNPPKESIAQGWLDLCRFVREESGIPDDAVFLVPRGCDSFKWNAHRPEAASWKEIPQDAASIVDWFRKMELFYTIPGSKGAERWNQPLVMVLIVKGRTRITEECQKNNVQYIVAESPPYTIAGNEKALQRYGDFFGKDLVYQNSQFTLFRIGGATGTPIIRNQ